MTTTTHDDVIKSLDIINESVDESVSSVFMSIVLEYDKISKIIDNAGTDSIYQEGQIWDTATGKGKAESNIMKIIAFIPRLFQGIINSITSAFKNTTEADIDKHAELAKNVITSANSQQLATAAKSVEQATEDNIGFDPNKKEFVFKKGFKHVRNAFFIISGLPDLFTKFIKRLKGGETQYDMMAKELFAVVTRKKDLDSESLYCTIDTMHELYKDGYKASMAVRGLSSEVSMLLEKKMRADFANGKNIEKEAEAKKLLDEISKTSKHIMTATFGLKILSKAMYLFGGPLYRKFVKGSPDSVELTSVETKRRDLQNRLKALKEKLKNVQHDKERAREIRNQIVQLQQTIAETQEEIDNTKMDIDDETALRDKETAEWKNDDPYKGSHKTKDMF